MASVPDPDVQDAEVRAAVTSPASVLIGAAQEAVRDIRTYSDFRIQRTRLRVGQVQALCAIAAALDRLAEAITQEEA